MSFFGDFVGVRFFSWPQESAYKEKHTTHVTRTADTRGQGKSCLRGQTLPSPIVFATKAADKATQTVGAADTRGHPRTSHISAWSFNARDERYRYQHKKQP